MSSTMAKLGDDRDTLNRALDAMVDEDVPGTYTILIVRDLGDPVAGIKPYEARYRIADRHEAWLRYHLAIAAGFDAHAERVKGEA